KKEEKYLPIWHFSEKPPWNVANRLSEFPYPNITWCVIHPNGRKEARKLQPMLPEDQLIFKGDRVQILCGPDKGRVALLDPSNNEPCKCSWRYTEEGNRVRVSLQTGHVIPLPAAARHLDDLTDPKTAVVSSKDTCEPVVCNVSLKSLTSTSDVNFEKSLLKDLKLRDDCLNQTPTYWY
ncbi:unnamed protein product, partial [Schistosoma mattheei]